MISREGKLGILSALFVQSAIWLSSTFLPATSDQLSPWDGNSNRYRRYATRRPYWDRYTSSPDHYEYNSSSIASDPVLWLPIIGAILLVLLLVLLRYLCKCYGSDTEDSSTTLHPPPARILPPPNRSVQSFGSQNARSPNTSTGNSYSFSTRNSTGISSTYNAGDRPPSYFAVASDSEEGKTKFPEVSLKLHECPPPKYED